MKGKYARKSSRKRTFFKAILKATAILKLVNEVIRFIHNILD